MPTLTAKAAAELLQLPGYEQLRILTEQKYPRREPNSYRTPFYRAALAAISSFYRRGNDVAIIAAAKHSTVDLKPRSKRTNNARVLRAFERSTQFERQLTVRPKKDFEADIEGVTVRLAADLLALEDGEPKVFFYNCRSVAIPSELARTTLEIAHWIFEENDSKLPMSAFEYIDFIDQEVHTVARRRKTTITRLRNNAQVIKALWDAV